MQHFYQNQRYSFGDFDTKKITLFYSGSGTMNSSQTGDTLVLSADNASNVKFIGSILETLK